MPKIYQKFLEYLIIGVSFNKSVHLTEVGKEEEKKKPRHLIFGLIVP